MSGIIPEWTTIHTYTTYILSYANFCTYIQNKIFRSLALSFFFGFRQKCINFYTNNIQHGFNWTHFDHQLIKMVTNTKAVNIGRRVDQIFFFLKNGVPIMTIIIIIIMIRTQTKWKIGSRILPFDLVFRQNRPRWGWVTSGKEILSLSLKSSSKEKNQRIDQTTVVIRISIIDQSNKYLIDHEYKYYANFLFGKWPISEIYFVSCLALGELIMWCHWGKKNQL